MNKFFKFVANELDELETRDVDTLYECLMDSLEEQGKKLTEDEEQNLYNEIERQVEAEKRADNE